VGTISYFEILQGILNKAELTAVKKMLTKRSATIHPVTESITLRATELLESLTLSHGLQMGDALIAATALELNQTLLTANVKHFNAISGLLVEGFLV
jgi:predicted nucleic acid-binding protein